jgi:DNA-binding IclR family transcriptional regulator
MPEPPSDRSASPKKLGFLSQSIQRALDVIEALSAPEAADGLTLTELAQVLEIPKSTAVRLLANLEIREFVEQDAARRYRIGMRLFSIGGRALSQSHLRATARPFLEDLTLRVGESTYLGILDLDKVLYIDRIESPQPVMALSPIGSHRPANSTAIGKVLLAGMGREQAEGLLAREGLTRRTAHTVVDRGQLLEQLDEIAEAGFAIDVGEWDEGLTCLAAPIHNRFGTVVAALGVSGPSWRVSAERVPEVSGLLIAAAQGIERELRPRETADPEEPAPAAS